MPKRNRPIGKLIREARLSRGLTQTDLARQLGVSQTWVSDVERDEMAVTVDRLRDLARVLGVEWQVGGRGIRTG